MRDSPDDPAADAVLVAERDQALRVAEDMVAGATRRHGGVLLVTGPAGSGKTVMIRAVRRIAAVAGCTVVEAATSVAAHQVPGGVAHQLVRPGAAPAPGSRTLFDLCAEVLHRAERDGPLVLVVDDVQHADQFSIDFLLSLITRLHPQPILVVLGELDGVDPLTLLHAEILRQPRSRRVRLAPLSPAAVQQVLVDRLDPRTVLKLATECHAISGGNPLLVHALVDDHLAANFAMPPRRRCRMTVGPSFRAAVVASVHRCGPQAVRVARGIAVLGGIGTTARLAALTGEPPYVVDRVVAALTAGGFLTLEGFRHRAAADAVRAELDPADLAGLGLRAAELLYEEGLPALDVARQLVAVPGVPGGWAVEVLVQAAGKARLEGRTALAGKCLDLADRTCRDERQRVPVLAMLAGLSWQADPMTTGRHLARLTGPGADELPAPTVALMIGYLLWCGRADQAQQLASRLDAPRDDRPVTRFWLGWTYPALLDRVPATALSALAAGDLRTTRPLLPAATALHDVLTDGPDRAAVASAEWSLHGRTLTHETLVPVLTALEALMYAGEPAKATRWCTKFLASARRCDAPMWEALFLAAGADIAFRNGDLSAAEQQARAALTTVGHDSWGVAVGGPLATLVRSLTAQGHDEKAARYLDNPVPDGVADTRHGLMYRYARAHHHLATGRLETALAGFRACGDLAAHWELDLPELLPWRTDMAEVHLRLGRPGQARALAEDQIALTGRRRCRSTGQALRVLAVAGGAGDPLAALAEAAELAQRAGDRLGLAGTLCDLGEVLFDRGELDRVQPVLHRAWQLTEACRAEPLRRRLSAGRAGRWAGLPTACHDDRTSLSIAERKVAALAASGYANREIAARLFITVSTVEQHLTRTYRKLKVNRRRDLPADLTHEVVQAADLGSSRQLQES